MNKLLILILLISFSLSACGPSKQIENEKIITGEGAEAVEADVTDADSDQISEQADGNLLFPDRKEVQDVYLVRERLISGDVCIKLSEEEMETVLDQLYGTDNEEFEEAELSGVGGYSVYFLLVTNSENIYVQILKDDSLQYLLIQKEEEQLFLKCPADSFDFNSLRQLAESVMANDANRN